MLRTKKYLPALISVFLLGLTGCPSFGQSGTTYILVDSGSPIPDGPGTVDEPSNFALSSGGAAYMASLKGTAPGTGTFGLYTATADGVQKIFRVGETAPSGGTITGLADLPYINASGEVLAYTVVGSHDALLMGDGTTLRTVAQYGQTVPGGTSAMLSFSSQKINNLGDAAFNAALIEGPGPSYFQSAVVLWKQDGSAYQITRTGNAAPGETNTFSSLYVAGFNNNDQVLVDADLTGPGYGTGNNSGLYLGTTSGLTKIARSFDPAPSSPYLLGHLQSFSLNDIGQTVFRTNLINSGGTNQGTALIIGSTGGLSMLAQTGEAAPGGGTFSDVYDANFINNSGKVAFVASLTGTTSTSALMLGDGTTLTTLNRTGDHAPSGATYTGFSIPRINDTGTVAFVANLNGSPFGNGIFLTDGTQSLTVAQAGSKLDGKTIYSVGFDPKAYNDFEQLAYQVEFTDGTYAIAVFTPDISWRGTSGGSWDAATNWTVSLKPGEYNDIGMNPTLGGTIEGPGTDTTVASLYVGGGSHTTELHLGSGVLSSTDGVSVRNNGILGGNGTLAGAVTVDSGGTTYPGDPSTTTMNSVHYTSGSKAEFSIVETRTSDGTHTVTPGVGGPTGDYDQIVLLAGATGTLQIDSGVTLKLDLSDASITTLQTHSGVDRYFLFRLDDGTSAGEFTTLTIDDGDGHTYSESLTDGSATIEEIGLRFDLSYTGDYATNSLFGGNDVVLTTESLVPPETVVPEPGTNALLLLGGLALGLIHFRSRRKVTRLS